MASIAASCAACWLSIGLAVGTLPAALAQDAAAKRSVVAFYGSEPRAPAHQIFDAALRGALAGAQPSLEVYSEYLQVGRFEGPDQQARLASYLKDRYAGTRIDVLVTSDRPSLLFLARHRDTIFPGVPVVVADVRRQTLEQARVPPDFIGTPVDADARPIVELALRLRPATREIVIVAGTDEFGRSWETRLHTAARTAATSIPVRTLSHLALAEVERELRALGPEHIVLLAPYRRDGAGAAHVGALFNLDRFKAASQAPIFDVSKEGVARGAVATVAVPHDAVAQHAAGIARDLLSGLPPASVVLPPPPEARAYVNWRELQRLGIDEALVPQDAEVMFREPTFWDQYRYHAMGAGLLLALQTALIAGLLVQRSRRRRVEEALRESEARFRIVADTAPVMIWRSDVEGRFDFFNRPWLQFTGRTLGEEAGDGWWRGVHPEDLDLCRGTYRRAFTARQPFRMEYRLRRFDGEYRWMLDVGIPRSETSTFTGFIGSCLDISERRQAEQALREAHLELGRLSRLSALGEFAATIAHEIRQPLTAIIMNARSCLRQLGVAAPHIGDVEAGLLDVVEAGQRAEEVIQRNRRLFRDQAVETTPLDINGVIREALGIAQARMTAHHVAVTTTLGADLPAVAGDRIELQQVLLNLLANAVEAMESIDTGSRRIDVRSARAAQGGVEVTVADRGVGFQGIDIQRIFDLSFSTKRTGTGIGLSISRSIIDAHGGHIWAEPNPGGGALFRFTLPARPAESAGRVEAWHAVGP